MKEIYFGASGQVTRWTVWMDLETNVAEKLDIMIMKETMWRNVHPGRI